MLSKINFYSFGYKYGLPKNADFVFDVRCLPNPFWVDDLKSKDGTNAEVSKYVFNSMEAVKYYQSIRNIISQYINLSKKDTIEIYFGCTGGKHRSVAFAQKIFFDFKNAGINCSLTHREQEANW